MTMHADDEVTLVATIVVRYSAVRGEYQSDSGELLTDEEMAECDQDDVQAKGTVLGAKDVLDWAPSPRDVAVVIRPE